MTTKCFLLLCGVIAVIAIYFPARHARRYDFIEEEDILNELVTENNLKSVYNLKLCNYVEKIVYNVDIEVGDILLYRNYSKPNKGGEYIPTKCKAYYKTALIIPYRDRSDQLISFLSYIHEYLQNQDIIYRIFVIEQNDSLPFNRAKMFNYGAAVAMQYNYTCLILHDVDLLPTNSGNIYACSKKPRHMSSSLDTFRYNLPYLTLFGGAAAILSDHYLKVNGMSNLFYGWGGEDDDFYKRLQVHGLSPYRFSPKISKYSMMFHKKEKASHNRFNHLQNSIKRHKIDGMNSLSDNYEIQLKDLYTHVFVS